jgi:putative peptide zinc metalloprotease protein
VPQNLAAAVNYNCIECVTYALAKQLVVTIDGPLSDEAMAKLEALWQEIAEFGANIADVPLDEIEDQLQQFQDEIMAVIEEDKGPLLPGTPTGSPSSLPSAGTPSPSPSVTDSPDSGTPSGNGSSPSPNDTVEPGSSPGTPTTAPTPSEQPSSSSPSADQASDSPSPSAVTSTP